MEEKKKTRWSKEKVFELFENNEIRNITEFQRRFSGACIYSYRHNLIDELPFTSRGTPKTPKTKSYDVTKVIHYLERWAREENTSVQYQASKYGYGTEYREYIQIKNK